MNKKRVVHTGPKTQLGGLKEGLARPAYHGSRFGVVSQDPKPPTARHSKTKPSKMAADFLVVGNKCNVFTISFCGAQPRWALSGVLLKIVQLRDRTFVQANRCYKDCNIANQTYTAARPTFVFSKNCEKIGPLAAPIARAFPPMLPASILGAIKPRMS